MRRRGAVLPTIGPSVSWACASCCVSLGRCCEAATVTSAAGRGAVVRRDGACERQVLRLSVRCGVCGSCRLLRVRSVLLGRGQV